MKFIFERFRNKEQINKELHMKKWFHIKYQREPHQSGKLASHRPGRLISLDVGQ